MDQFIEIKNKRIEAELIENGFTQAPLLLEEQIKELRKVYEVHFADVSKNDRYNLNSNADCHSAQKKLISDEILRIVKPSVDTFFSNYEFLPGIFFIKKYSKDTSSSIPIHQDPTLFINEQDKQHIRIWCPLHDVDETNGTMFAVRGSHKFTPPVSAVTVPSHFSNVKELVNSCLECVPLKAGEAIIFDNRTIHYTSPNKTNNIRVAVIISIVIPNKQFISLYKEPNNENSPIEVYFQNKDWFFHPLWKNDKTRPLTGVKKGILDYKVVLVTPQEFTFAYQTKQPIRHYDYKIRSNSFWYNLRNFFFGTSNTV